MDVKVRFRFNKITGEVEIFEVADEGNQRLSEAEHNRQHDKIASAIGGVIERFPRITELFPDAAVPVEHPDIKEEKTEQTDNIAIQQKKKA